MTSSTSASTESISAEGPGDGISLWNPAAAAAWSFLLTPALGPYLHMRNWERLGRNDKAQEARSWFVISIALHLLVILVLAVPTAMGEDITLPPGIGMGLCGVWFMLSGYPQVKHIQQTQGAGYVRRAWSAPLLVTLGLVIGLLFFSGLVLAIVSP